MVEIMNHYEHDQQVALFEWRKYSNYKDCELKWMHSIPNGYTGDQSKIRIRGRLISKAAIQMNRMKAAGLTPGVWDIFIPWPVQKYSGMYIEMKSPGKGLTPEQAEFQKDNPAYYFAIAYDWIQAKDAIIQYLAGERF